MGDWACQGALAQPFPVGRAPRVRRNSHKSMCSVSFVFESVLARGAVRLAVLIPPAIAWGDENRHILLTTASASDAHIIWLP